MDYLKKADPEISDLVLKEKKRQQETLMMIPSENYASLAVMEALGSCLTNKYAEGYPAKRYYQGQEFIDQIERLTIARAKRAFMVPFANVQALSGAAANFAVYTAVLKPGDKVLSLKMDCGGHLTHGSPASVVSKIYQVVNYGVDDNARIDYQKLAKLAEKEKPKLMIAGYSAYPFLVDWQKFAEISRQSGALLMADIAHLAGLIVSGNYPSPVNFVDIVTTTTHKTLRGPRGAIIMVTQKGLAKDEKLADKINRSVFPGIQGGPHINAIAAIGVALAETEGEGFADYGRTVINNARVLSKEMTNHGLKLVGGGTESHLMLLDLVELGITGNLVAEALEKAGIVVNKNLIPNDPATPFYPSGIRLGTPAVTSRGMGEPEMKQVAGWISLIVSQLRKAKIGLGFNHDDEKIFRNRQEIIREVESIKKISYRVVDICWKFPVKKEY
ncbi:MAG: serine hydroxymethyltransferase [Patescibacteria group bacterium]|nr:serine hydroxymethyltransferase [Patescibacteria group bacterium]